MGFILTTPLFTEYAGILSAVPLHQLDVWLSSLTEMWVLLLRAGWKTSVWPRMGKHSLHIRSASANIFVWKGKPLAWRYEDSGASAVLLVRQCHGGVVRAIRLRVEKLGGCSET